MGEGGGGEEKGRPDTKPFSKSCDTSKIWMWQWLDNKQYPLTSPTARAIGKETVIEIFHRCFDFMLPLSLFRFHFSPFPQKRLILRLPHIKQGHNVTQIKIPKLTIFFISPKFHSSCTEPNKISAILYWQLYYMVYCCLRADVSYFLCCKRKRVPFPRTTKEIGDVCTQARYIVAPCSMWTGHKGHLINAPSTLLKSY